MELKTARLTLLIDPNKKAAFERLCAAQDLTPSQVVRRLIRDYLALHGASFQPAGMASEGADPAEADNPAARPSGGGAGALPPGAGAPPRRTGRRSGRPAKD